MPTESEFRTLLKNEVGDATGSARFDAGRLDAAAIIRRSKRRRLPAQLTVGGLSTLAVAGIGFVGVSAFRAAPPGASTTSMGASVQNGTRSEQAAPGAAQGIKRAPADRINLCGGAVANVAPNSDGLVLSTVFPESSAIASGPVNGTVTLTNNGTQTVKGTTAASPAITVAKDGMVLWHSNGAMIMVAVPVDLAPGQSMSYPASFTPVRCESVDDVADGFRDNLPALGAGSYQISAAIDLVRESAEGEFSANDLVTGPAQTVTLR